MQADALELAQPEKPTEALLFYLHCFPITTGKQMVLNNDGAAAEPDGGTTYIDAHTHKHAHA